MPTVEIKTTDVFSRLYDNWNHRYLILQGGTSSSKTWSILQSLYFAAYYSQKPILISIVSESMPHLKRGAMRDFFQIIGDAYLQSGHNKTDNIYHVNNSMIEFFSADQPDKVRGARRDVLFINEANNISYDTFQQLEVRTKQKVIIDFNPVQEFWAHENIINSELDKWFDISTYKDNKYLDNAIVQSIESRKEKDANWWRVYGEGQIGSLEGLVYPRFQQVEQMPDDCRINAHGLDWGYTNDPSALVRIGIRQDKLYLQELFYETGLTNNDITGKFRQLNIRKNYDEIFADCAEPKSIEDLKRAGYNVKPARKGADSVINGIDLIKQYDIYATKDSVNLIKELRNYSWIKDRDGKITNKPGETFNHALDAVRYAVTMKVQRKKFDPFF